MKRVGFGIVVLALPVIASANPGNGIDMQWQDCVGGPEAVSDRTFDCSGNSTHSLNLNFKISQALPGFVAFTAYIDMGSETPGPLAPFWHYETGGCQRMGGTSPNGVATSLELPATAWCSDNFSDVVDGDPSAAFHGIGAFGPDVRIPGHGVFVIGLATSMAIPIAAGENKFAMSLLFNTRNRLGGPGGANCAGCGQKIAMALSTVSLESNDGAAPLNLYSADKGQTCATIQGATPALCAAVPVRTKTWGALKALYR